MPNRIIFYADRKGRQPVKDFIDGLLSQSGKNARINYKKVAAYINYLSEVGLAGGEPYMKHLKGEIWELRPLRNRILFAALVDDGFILLHVFLKKTQKTPAEEIEKAEKELKDYKERLKYE